MTFKPMLACNADLSRLKFPLLASPKFDGIRCVVLDGKALTRNLKPIPNDYTRGWLEKYCDGLDGELVVGNPTAKDCFQKTTSAVMSKDGAPSVVFYAFDVVNSPLAGFEMRLASVQTLIDRAAPFCSATGIIHPRIGTPELLATYEAQLVAEGWEGVMLRDPNGLYKYGRSTVKEGGLLKVKRFADAEAIIVGFEERMHNGNAATVDALGHTERSTHKANMQPLGDLGALVVKPVSGPLCIATLRLGTGFTADQRRAYWAVRDQLLGKVVTFSFQEVGSKDAPRFPVFKGFRPEGA